jgi:enamine deaminase RidA (YjgF/YER057c/UK114 family)
MSRIQIDPPAMRQVSAAYNYSQATRVGDTIWLSGQTGITAEMAPAKGIAAQTRQAFSNLQTVLEEAGATLADIVDLVTFHTDLQGQGQEFMAVKNEVMGGAVHSWTAVGVAQLADPQLLVEIRAVAVVGSAAK